MTRLIDITVGHALALRDQADARLRARDERGVSLSTEQAILLAAAVGVAITIVALVGPYVAAKLAEIR